MEPEREADEYEGEHQFRRESRDLMDDPEPYGKFEVRYFGATLDPTGIGWYWCLLEPGRKSLHGPFDTSDEAFADAQENRP